MTKSKRRSAGGKAAKSDRRKSPGLQPDYSVIRYSRYLPVIGQKRSSGRSIISAWSQTIPPNGSRRLSRAPGRVRSGLPAMVGGFRGDGWVGFDLSLATDNTITNTHGVSRVFSRQEAGRIGRNNGCYVTANAM